MPLLLLWKLIRREVEERGGASCLRGHCRATPEVPPPKPPSLSPADGDGGRLSLSPSPLHRQYHLRPSTPLPLVVRRWLVSDLVLSFLARWLSLTAHDACKMRCSSGGRWSGARRPPPSNVDDPHSFAVAWLPRAPPRVLRPCPVDCEVPG